MQVPKTWLTISIFCLLAAIPYFVPAGERFRILDSRRIPASFAAWRPGAIDRVILRPRPVVMASTKPATANVPVLASNAPAAPPGPASLLSGDYVGKNWPVEEDMNQILKEPAESVAVQDYGCGMNHFYASLALTEQKQPGAITRISHFGDSPISGDLISGEARALLQEKFGDSGHGWIFVAKPWDFYYHEAIRMEGDGWEVSSPVIPGGTGGSFGLGGASFTASSPSAVTLIRTMPKGEGSAVSQFEVFYRAQPRGGSFLVYVDKEEPQRVSTQADTRGSAEISISVEDGGHSFKITPAGDGPVTLYGAVLERTTPGVVYDTLGMLGGTLHHLTRFHADTWAEDLQERKPDLVILNFGTNESNYGYLPFAEYQRNYSTVIERIRTALPGVSILIMAPMDRAVRDDDGDIVTIPSIPILVAAQQRVARTQGVAFYDTFAAMGGEGTMARWYDDKPRLVTGDFTHPTITGARQLGTMLVNSLLKGFDEYKKNPGNSPCVAPTAPPPPEQKAEGSSQP